MVVEFDGKGHPGSLVWSSSLHQPPFIPAQSSLRAQRKRTSGQEKAENRNEYFSKCFSSPLSPPSHVSLWPTPITEQQGRFSHTSAGVSVFLLDLSPISIWPESNRFVLLCVHKRHSSCWHLSNVTLACEVHATSPCLAFQNLAKLNHLLIFGPNFEVKVLSRYWNLSFVKKNL